jgi:hypothetical protein
LSEEESSCLSERLKKSERDSESEFSFGNTRPYENYETMNKETEVRENLSAGKITSNFLSLPD